MDMRVGREATAHDVVAMLEEACRERAGLPLVYSTDNGGPYRSRALPAYLASNRVVHLRNLPHTPQHNAWAERAIGELKGHCGLGKGVVLDSLETAALRVADSRERLDSRRLRASRGWRTAQEGDRTAPRWYPAVSRERFYTAARAAIARAMAGCTTERGRRHAAGEAIFATLERFGDAGKATGSCRSQRARHTPWRTLMVHSHCDDSVNAAAKLNYNQVEGARSSNECHKWMAKLWIIQVGLMYAAIVHEPGNSTLFWGAFGIGILSLALITNLMVREHRRGARHRKAAYQLVGLGEERRPKGFPFIWVAIIHAAMFATAWTLALVSIGTGSASSGTGSLQQVAGQRITQMFWLTLLLVVITGAYTFTTILLYLTTKRFSSTTLKLQDRLGRWTIEDDLKNQRNAINDTFARSPKIGSPYTKPLGIAANDWERFVPLSVVFFHQINMLAIVHSNRADLGPIVTRHESWILKVWAPWILSEPWLCALWKRVWIDKDLLDDELLEWIVDAAPDLKSAAP